MAITLNKHAIRCEKMALTSGKITRDSSAGTFLYDISRNWRLLAKATVFKSLTNPKWSEREVAAAEVLVSTITYLQRIGCKDIEKLLKETIERHERKV